MGARNTVPPEVFAAAMSDRWIALGNVTSSALDAQWVTTGATFNEAILFGDSDNRWRVLQPPTGSGKTQGACVYASLIVTTNPIAIQPTGILVVVRTIAQADAFVADTASMLPDGNEHKVVAKHSANKTTAAEMARADVLVITHEAYVRALIGVEAASVGRWNHYTNWLGGRRYLTIIDETLSGVIEQRQVNVNDIKRVLTVLTPQLKQRFSGQVAALNEVLRVLEVLDGRIAAEDQHLPAACRGWSRQDSTFDRLPECYRMGGLRMAIRDLPFDLVLMNQRCEETRLARVREADATLDGVERMLGEWTYVARNDGRYALHHAFFLAPKDLPGPVVLDATATQNFLWNLLEDRAVLVPTPQGVRRYDNVRLRVVRVQRLGKESMRKLGKFRIPKIISDVEMRVAGDEMLDDKRVLAVLHKDVLCHAVTDDPRFAGFQFANWGGIDGKNDWNDFGTVVLFGLHNLPDVWAHNMFAALQGVPSREWFEAGAWKGLENVRLEMHRRQLTASIIQAINRVRCRRTLDGEGRCKPTSIYLALKPGEEGNVILQYIQEEMPGIVVEEWPLELEGPRLQLNHRSRHPAILAYMETRRPGRTSLNALIDDLGLPPSFKRELQKTLRDPTHPLTKALLEMNVFYVSDGKGRGKGSYLLKASG